MLLNCPTGFQNTDCNTKAGCGAMCEKGWFRGAGCRILYKKLLGIWPDNFSWVVGIMEMEDLGVG